MNLPMTWGAVVFWPQELAEAVALLQRHERGLVKPSIRRGIEWLLQHGASVPLGWLTAWGPRMREAFNR